MVSIEISSLFPIISHAGGQNRIQLGLTGMGLSMKKACRNSKKARFRKVTEEQCAQPLVPLSNESWGTSNHF